VSIGESLAQARRQAGLTVTQVSQQTRIREAIVRGIEQDDFTACGGDFYARGHIRSIAAAVGTDPAPLISEYDAEHGPPHALRAADVFEPSTPIKIRERHPPRLRTFVVLVLLAIIGYSAYHLISTRGAKHNLIASGTHTTQPPASPTPPSPTPTPTSSPTPTVSNVVINVVTGQEPCWVLLTNASDGSQIYMGTILAGSTMTWTEPEAVDIRLGNPAAVVLTVNGKRQPLKTVLPVTLSFNPGTSSSPPSASPSSTPSG
jgi:transcriptional regulator with XRE-family HTH domain